MKDYQKDLAVLLARSGALFFQEKGLSLKDGRPTPYFVNFGFFKTGRLIAELGRIMAEFLVDCRLSSQFDVLVGPSYKGSALAVTAAVALWSCHGEDKGFDYDRKESKTHGEASGGAANFVTGALHDRARVMIIDDVVTTMGTKFALLAALSREATARGHCYHPAGVVLFLDRQQSTVVPGPDGRPVLGLRGEDAVQKFTAETGLPVNVVLGIRETVKYLAAIKEPVRQDGQWRPLAGEALKTLNDYWNIYGV